MIVPRWKKGAKEWLTIDDLAAMFEVPKKTVYQWNINGRGPAVTHIGRYVRYSRRAVDEWTAARTGTPGAA